MQTKIDEKQNTINVLFLAAEADPLIKIGGLGDVAYALPAALRELSPEETNGYTIDARLVLPCHGGILDQCEIDKTISTFGIPYPGGLVPASAFTTSIDGLPTYLISGSPIPQNSPVYSNNSHLDGLKFVFFSLASQYLAKQINWKLDILHANDWHTALSVYKLKKVRELDPFYKDTKSVLTIHNLPYLGNGTEQALMDFGIPLETKSKLPAWAKQLPFPLGLSAADHITAVSPTYAKEIMTPEYSSGLEKFLKTRKSAISGIINGLDYQKWDPQTDSKIEENFSISTIEKRKNNKKALLQAFNFDPIDTKPLLILISRMDHQKGIDTALESLENILDLDWNAIFLGTGNKDIEKQTKSLEKKVPKRFRAVIDFDAALARRMYAGGDMILMPSRYEPCGLAQIIAMKYGCIPIATATGGLKDTITTKRASRTGYLSKEKNTFHFSESIASAIKDFNNPKLWIQIQINAMKENFSWKKSALSYASLYIDLLKESNHDI
ncbi:MAG: glycogen synthase [Anaerolineaceae bacterium]|nr:glycogen synthase [Anaerolineaceae bacterium]